MDNAVALVQAYLQVDEYFTVAEYPVLQAARHGIETATEIDVRAFRFPGAGRLVPAKKGARERWLTDVDPVLVAPTGQVDMLIGEVKEGREVTNIRSNDMVVIVGGSSGALGEFAIAYDEGKLIGVLQGSGGITATIPEIVAGFGDKNTGARLVYESDSAKLVQRLVESYAQSHYRRPSCFCDKHAGTGT
jgi:hypothetical protein